jgi:ribonuclease D
MTNPFIYVADNAQLLHSLRAFEPSPYVALDTEFMRESTYFPKLCLLQLATIHHCVVIDPLSSVDLDPVWTFLSDPARIKVLHSARQDLEVLSIAGGQQLLRGPFFDTQIAAGLLGASAQVGFGTLVADKLGHVLPKGHTRADWTKRPLSPEQLEYAADDVRFLAPLFLQLREELDATQRTSWEAEEAIDLQDPSLYRTDPSNAWRRLKGLDRLRADQRATAKLLAEWRERQAVEHDKPRGWILTDEALRQIAERLPNNATELEKIDALPPGTLRKRGEELIELVRQGLATSDDDAANIFRPTLEQTANVTRLMAAVRTRATELKVTPELLATRRDVEQLVFFGRSERLTRGWRQAVIGEILLAMT